MISEFFGDFPNSRRNVGFDTTFVAWLMTSETVEIDTHAFAAISFMVTIPPIVLKIQL